MITWDRMGSYLDLDRFLDPPPNPLSREPPPNPPPLPNRVCDAFLSYKNILIKIVYNIFLSRFACVQRCVTVYKMVHVFN